jgi:hypothetical protein
MHDHSQPQNTADSAGFPWEGRSFDAQSDVFANDAGETPAELAQVIADFRAGKASQADVVAVFATARVLIPLLTVAGDIGETPDGRTVDKTQELSIVTVQAPDGRKVLPVFSSVAAMNRWNPDARPVPNFGRNVAVAALDDDNDLVILDPTTQEMEFGIRRPALWALTQDALHTPSWLDDAVAAEFTASIATEPDVLSVTLANGDPDARLMSPELLVTLALTPGLSQDALAQVVQRLQTRWGASAIIAERVDSMTLRLSRAE